MKSDNNGLVVRDWKPDVVYLVQFPRTHTIPSASPFALKLETWLRMNGLKYRNVSNEFKKMSAKGQIPFIEMNGRQIADSNVIIEHLKNHFKLAIDGKLNSIERANARAYTVLIEESLFRCCAYDRMKDVSWLFTADKGWIDNAHGINKLVLQKLGERKYKAFLKKVLHSQGYGRLNQTEIEDVTKKDLMALSTMLGDKQFLFGDHPTTLDATMFGHLAQFTENPLFSKEVKPMLEKSAPNLLAFVQRMKRRYWPDWEAVIAHLAMNPDDEVGAGAAAHAEAHQHGHHGQHGGAHHGHQHQQVKAH